jgi:hypothetical protein
MIQKNNGNVYKEWQIILNVLIFIILFKIGKFKDSKAYVNAAVSMTNELMEN